MTGLMKIGDLARATGVNPRLLRYYEEQGLITSQRTASGHRHYTAETVEGVERVRTLLAVGLSTAVIRELMPCFIAGTELHPCAGADLQTHLDELEARIAEMEHTRASLGSLIAAAKANPPNAA
ncbi:MerR family transcriptional regulator [Yinghuangia aomiensis]|uniref:MerR family transcriptional regulator n=1 Tax=Yinghuangia aomiensis TaxID=676205 RepID=A0ABP9GVE9_9ACTN